MARWVDGDNEYDWNDLELHVEVTDNPVVAELLDADGNVIRQWTKRPPPGYRRVTFEVEHDRSDPPPDEATKDA